MANVLSDILITCIFAAITAVTLSRVGSVINCMRLLYQQFLRLCTDCSLWLHHLFGYIGRLVDIRRDAAERIPAATDAPLQSIDPPPHQISDASVTSKPCEIILADSTMFSDVGTRTVARRAMHSETPPPATVPKTCRPTTQAPKTPRPTSTSGSTQSSQQSPSSTNVPQTQTLMSNTPQATRWETASQTRTQKLRSGDNEPFGSTAFEAGLTMTAGYTARTSTKMPDSTQPSTTKAFRGEAARTKGAPDPVPGGFPRWTSKRKQTMKYVEVWCCVSHSPHSVSRGNFTFSFEHPGT